jgi:EAL domain-containing protein (putative c-di-GMP-specific phosphodiesterase class I)
MGAIRTWDAPPDQLFLEVTENTIMEHPETCLQTREQPRSNNIMLFIDDFGTGYSSFS